MAAASDQYPDESGRSVVTLASLAHPDSSKTIWHYVGSYTAPPAWSPDGKRLAVVIAPPLYPTPVGHPTPDGLWVINTDGTDAHLVAPDAVGPSAWNPTGTQIAYLAGRNGPAQISIRTVAADGGTATTLATEPDAPQNGVTLSWSPDGTTLAVTVDDLDYNPPRAGHSQLVLLDTANGHTTKAFSAQANQGFEGAFYSPNGTEIALSVICNYGTTTNTESAGLVIANAELTEFHQLGSTRSTSSYCPLPLVSSYPEQLRADPLTGWVTAPPP
jgi:hypothetical protein